MFWRRSTSCGFKLTQKWYNLRALLCLKYLDLINGFFVIKDLWKTR